MAKQNPLTDTISAPATSMANAGIGIIRISGDQSLSILKKLFRPYGENDFTPRKLILGKIYHPQKDKFLDEAMAVFFPGPYSYTKEDVVEFQCHGGNIVLSQVMEAILANGARMAQRGEFTLRAFLNGRLDLTQAEAVLDIIEAKTAVSLDLAENQLSGKLSEALAPLEEELLSLLAEIAAALDFPEDIDIISREEFSQRIEILDQKSEKLLAGADKGRIYREGLSVVLLGAANVGKSSLLNALLQEDRAIVTPMEGTTRDIIEEYLNLDGVPLLISDTAGLRQAVDEAEAIGIGKSRKKAATAQIILLIIDGSLPMTDDIKKLIEEYRSYHPIVVLNKADIVDVSFWQDDLSSLYPELTSIIISAKTGYGLPSLKEIILNRALYSNKEENNGFLINNLRHQEALL
ncbi:MAG: tRNA uridine-5-carboxymethylaminomethyl(34) synthesis GTPase MnmE, partial [Clostridiales bacterium]